MRRSFSISLLILLVFQTVLLLPLTKLSLEWHKEGVAQKLQSEEGKEELIQLKFTGDELREDLEWVEENEFVFQGWMYDLVEAERKGERYILTVYKDRRETRMKEGFEALQKRGPQGKKEKEARVISETQPFKYFKSSGIDFLFPTEYRLLQQKPASRAPLELVLDVPVPPPC